MRWNIITVTIFIENKSKNDFLIKLNNFDWELNIHIGNQELYLLKMIRFANWDTKSSIKAGTSSSSAVFWVYDEKNKMISICVGHDDETWDFAVCVPITIIEEAFEKLYT